MWHSAIQQHRRPRHRLSTEAAGAFRSAVSPVTPILFGAAEGPVVLAPNETV
jgi:hypothetical protein